MSSGYDVDEVLPAGMLSELRPGTSLLIEGPSMIGKRRLAIRLLAAGHREGDGILCVTTSNNAEKLLSEFEAEIPTLDRGRVGIVDCSGSDSQRTIEDIAMERVSSPGDLTGISIGTAKLLQSFAKQDVSGVRHGLVSVSTLIQYLDIGTVFKFLHIYTSRIADTDGLGVFTLDNSTHDQQSINTLTSEFDCVLEMREGDDGDREVRMKGLESVPREWHAYD
jgi:KaiC/GvpD/RAD55 family RecA-like ATPase